MTNEARLEELGVEMTVADAAAALSAGTTAEELTKVFLARIARVNPDINAIIIPNEHALEDAREIDRRRASGERLGPLAGVPIVVKDTMDMAGLPSTGGWHFLSSRAGGVDLIPATDSPVVARMRAAGCVILGKTNVPVLSATGSHASDSWAGPTLNVVIRDRKPGGSSAGSAAAVAASLCVLSLAEETGGSIQNPASAQDLVGLKPTFGLVPNAGVMPLAGSTRDVIGPIARCVRDAALALDALAGYTSEDPKTVAGIGHRPPMGYASNLEPGALKGKRIGLYGPGWRDSALSTEAERLYQRAIEELTRLGAHCVSDPFVGSGFAALGKPTDGLHHFDARGMESIPYDLQQYLARMGPDVPLRDFETFATAVAGEDPFAPGGVLFYMPSIAGFDEGRHAPSVPPDLSAFLQLKEAYLAIFDVVMSEHKLDALCFPQMLEELPPLQGPGILQESTVCEINIAGLPGLTVPAGYYASGSPFGLIFVGRPWAEHELIQLAYAYEANTGHRTPPKP